MEFKNGNQVIQNVESNSFSMAINGKAFAILAELYKNPIKAIIRELSTNASDSHKEAENPNPFIVNLPTIENLFFSIRDFGTGLSKHNFENVYFSMFESTKDNDNKYNGCLGLGKASSLSYNTKTFTIESWQNGIYLRYLCFIGNSGMPEFTLLNEESSNEQTGVKVTIPVKHGDIDKFKTFAESVYRWFDLKPITNIELNFKEYEVYSKNFATHSGKPLAVMANVAYPLENAKIGSNGIILFFETGEIEFTPSRESIKYTDITNAKINEKIDAVKRDINKIAEEKFNKCENEFQIIKTRLEFTKFNYLNNNITYRGNVIDTSPIDMDHSVRCFYGGKFRKHSQGKLRFNNPIFVLNDLKTGCFARSKRLSSEKNCIVYCFNDKSQIPIDIGNDYILASSLPSVERAKTISSGKRVQSFMKMKESSIAKYSWGEANIDTVVNKVYVVRKGYLAKYNENFINPCRIFRDIRKLGINTEIYGIIQKDENKIKESGFINIYDLVKNKTDELTNFIKNNEDYKKFYIERNLKYNLFGLFNYIKTLGLEDEEVFKDLNEYFNFYDTNKNEILKYIDYCTNLGMSYNNSGLDRYQILIDHSYLRPELKKLMVLGFIHRELKNVCC